MAKKAKKTGRGRKLDRKLVAGKLRYEVNYAAEKSKKSAKQVKEVVKKVGPSRRKVERALQRG